MRLFVAVKLPEDVVAHLCRMQDVLRPLIRGRWIAPEQLHITLKFLGETPDARVAEVIKTLRTISVGKPIELSPRGIVCFPPRGPVRIIAAEMMDPTQRCADLARKLDEAAQTAGFAAERRYWTPHITLARINPPASPQVREKAADAVANLPPGPVFSLMDYAVYQSCPQATGPVYVAVG